MATCGDACYCDDHFTVCTCVTSLRCAPTTNPVLYVNDISIKKTSFMDWNIKVLNVYSALKSTVMSCGIEVSMKYGTCKGKGLMGSTLGKWRECHTGGCTWAGDWWVGRSVCGEDIGKGWVGHSTGAVLWQEERMKMPCSLCGGWWLGRWETRPDRCWCLKGKCGEATTLPLSPWYLWVAWLF